ncbi:hypothetical protein HY095_00470 [Candidatus Micrarchaeota archaeon]|nr:hypothetical protein [Candidatus Micrarchaeota archaeon]
MATLHLTLRPERFWRKGITQHAAIVKTNKGIELWKYLHGEDYPKGVPQGIWNDGKTIATTRGMMNKEAKALNDEVLSAGSVIADCINNETLPAIR